jgi:hypothetical protein
MSAVTEVVEEGEFLLGTERSLEPVAHLSGGTKGVRTLFLVRSGRPMADKSSSFPPSRH